MSTAEADMIKTWPRIAEFLGVHRVTAASARKEEPALRAILRKDHQGRVCVSRADLEAYKANREQLVPYDPELAKGKAGSGRGGEDAR